MTITSALFFLACALTVLVHWQLPNRLRPAWLLTVSIAFVCTWSWQLAGILLAVAAVNYLLGRRLSRGVARQRLFLWLGISFNLFVLAGLKYGDFFLDSLLAWLLRLGLGIGAGAVTWLAPIGLSFTVVQMISYLVDVSRRPQEASASWIEFAVYVLYFPKFLSGPIERAKSFLPSVRNSSFPGWEKVTSGLGLILLGLIRKRLLADALAAMIPAQAFTTPLDYSASLLLTWLLGYAFALYNDFAGYSSIVRGLSRLLGIELAVNFNLPYLSRTFSEFWNRWHISLSNWLRDYIYFPVSRLLRSRFPVSENIFNLLLPPVVTMLVSGLWHGATWGLLLWGAVHGLLLALENVLRVRGRHVPPDELPPFRQVIQTASVFIVVMLGWLPFRADLVAAKRYLAGMILPAHWLAPDWLRFNQVLAGDLPYEGVYGWNIPDPRILILLLVGIGLDLLQRRKQDELFFRSWPGWVQAIGLALVVLALILAGFSDTAAPFIYQGF